MIPSKSIGYKIGNLQSGYIIGFGNKVQTQQTLLCCGAGDIHGAHQLDMVVSVSQLFIGE